MKGGFIMPFQYENRYVMTEEMLREYTGRVVCRGLAKNCTLISGLCALLCLAAARFHHLGAAAVLGSFAALGLAAGLSLPFLAARQLYSCESAGEETTVVQFGERILLTERDVGNWYDYSEITAVQVLRRGVQQVAVSRFHFRNHIGVGIEFAEVNLSVFIGGV